MAFIRTPAPSTLVLYCTHPLSPHTLATLQRDFDLSAFSPRHASVLLSVSPRTDFYGFTIEGVLERLLAESGPTGEDEEGERGILVADELTERDGDGLWYVEGWLTKDDLGEGFLDPQVQKKVKYDQKGNSNLAKKLRIFMHYAPILHVNLSIGNLGIPEMYTFPYNPDSPLNLIPQDGGADWRFMSPPTAYLIAGPSTYDRDTNAETGSTTKRLGASQKENNELKVYRLNDKWAEKLGVVPSWSAGWEWDGRTKDEQEAKMAEGAECLLGDKTGARKGIISFAQSWKWDAPNLPKKLTEDWRNSVRVLVEDHGKET